MKSTLLPLLQGEAGYAPTLLILLCRSSTAMQPGRETGYGSDLCWLQDGRGEMDAARALFSYIKHIPHASTATPFVSATATHAHTFNSSPLTDPYIAAKSTGEATKEKTVENRSPGSQLTRHEQN